MTEIEAKALALVNAYAINRRSDLDDAKHTELRCALLDAVQSQAATEALRAAEEREKGLREALVQHNDRLRSAAEVAARDGRETIWLSFRGQVRYTLAGYHELVREVRATLKGRSHDA